MMMQYRSVPLTALLWLLTVTVMASGWICMAVGHYHVAIMLGFTAILIAAVAATATVAGMALRTQGLIRIAHGLEGGPGVDPSGTDGIRRIH